jgi:hypothetical protein
MCWKEKGMNPPWPSEVQNVYTIRAVSLSADAAEKPIESVNGSQSETRSIVKHRVKWLLGSCVSGRTHSVAALHTHDACLSDILPGIFCCASAHYVPGLLWRANTHMFLR